MSEEVTGYLMNTLIPLGVSAVLGFIVWYFQKEKLALTYRVTESGTFPLGKTVAKYFVYDIVNVGNKVVENIDLKLEITDGEIDSIEFSNPQLIEILEKKEAQCLSKISFLNPKEKISAIITVKNTLKHSKVIAIARALGVTAQERKEEKPESSFSIALVILTIAISFFVTSTFTAIRSSEDTKQNSEETKRYVLKIIEHQSESPTKDLTPTKEQIIFKSLEKAGLEELAQKILIEDAAVTYWKTGLYLYNDYKIKKDNGTKYTNALIHIAQNGSIIADSSEAFLLFLASKIQKLDGNEERAKLINEECKKVAEEICNFLNQGDH